MIFPEQRKLFTSAEVVRACNISRTSLFRLEEIGFLKPYRINPDTGYRYYDLQNITAIGQYQRMQDLGLSKKEIVDIYFEKPESKKILERQRKKLNMIRRFLDEYDFRHEKDPVPSGSFITLPSVSCYCKDITVSSSKEMAKFNYLAHEECVKKGYRMLGREPLFAVLEDRDIWKKFLLSGGSYTLCLPVIPGNNPDPDIRFFEETKAFSLVGFGDYQVIPKLCEKFWKEFDKRHLSPLGHTRVIMHVGAYAGSHYHPQDFCYEVIVPVNAT